MVYKSFLGVQICVLSFPVAFMSIVAFIQQVSKRQADDSTFMMKELQLRTFPAAVIYHFKART